MEVLNLVVSGYTNQEIGERLFISSDTAAKHVHHVLGKTGMANRAELTAYALRHGIVD
jgi:DNA-binding NarL/FixJ family response regulator